MERKDVLLEAIKKMELLLQALSKKITHDQTPAFIAQVFLKDLNLDLFSEDMEDFSKQVLLLQGMDQNNFLSLMALLQYLEKSPVNNCFALEQKMQVVKQVLQQNYKVFVF